MNAGATQREQSVVSTDERTDRGCGAYVFDVEAPRCACRRRLARAECEAKERGGARGLDRIAERGEGFGFDLVRGDVFFSVNAAERERSGIGAGAVSCLDLLRVY